MTSVLRKSFGRTGAGDPVEQFTLTHPGGIRAVLINYGATLVELHVPDRDGKTADVTLGFSDMNGYLSEANQSFGCTIGRVANRIGHARFALDGKIYRVTPGVNGHCLHGGGERAWARVLWDAEPISDEAGPAVRFSYRSRDGEEGFPGNVDALVVYSLGEDRQLVIDYEVRTDFPTPINLTNHAYWNLAGHDRGTVADHEIMIAGGRFTPSDDELIPTGEILPVAGTPFDLRESRRMSEGIKALANSPAMGFDVNFALDGASGQIRRAACVRDPESGRVLEIDTTEPGIQFYTGNSLYGQTGKNGAAYPKHGAFCLETQGFPDAVNQPAFPSIILRPGETYRQTTVHRFSAE